MFICMQKSTSSLTSFRRYHKNIENLLFWELWEFLIITIKIMVSICSKQFWRYRKDIGNLLFWELWECLIITIKIMDIKILQRNSKQIILGNLDIPGYTPKMIVLTCKRLQCLSACQKYTSSLTSFLRYYILKNLAI